jgi:hypothetical protein
VIVQVQVACFASSAIPPEYQSPLLIDSDGMEALQVATQFFEVITRGNSQVLICRRVIDHLNLAKQPALNVCRDLFRSRVADKEVAQPKVSETHYHSNDPAMSQCTTQRYKVAMSSWPARRPGTTAKLKVALAG